MILLFITLYVLIAICVGYGYLIFEYKKNYQDIYSFKEALKRLDDDIDFAVLIGTFFPIALVACICWLIGHSIVKLIDKIA